MDDYDLIEASFYKQYGIRLKVAELNFDEFLNLTSCLMQDTPLGQVVAIRSEDDPEVLEYFTDAQKKMRSDWRNRKNNHVNSEREYRESMDKLFAMFRA